jgi:hypothetical protein
MSLTSISSDTTQEGPCFWGAFLGGAGRRRSALPTAFLSGTLTCPRRWKVKMKVRVALPGTLILTIQGLGS